MAEQGVLRDVAADTALKGIDVIDAFANIDALAKQILIHIRYGMRVEVETPAAGIDAREPGARRPSGMHIHARLHDGVSGDDLTLFVELRPVQGMSQGANQAPRGARWHDGIRIQRNHIARRLQQGLHLWRGTLWQVRRVRLASQELVQLVELAPLALPAHPATLNRVPNPPAV